MVKNLWTAIDSRTYVLLVPHGMLVKSVTWKAEGGEGSEALVYVPRREGCLEEWIHEKVNLPDDSTPAV